MALKVTFDPPHFFPHRVSCGGHIPDKPEAIALWYYFLLAMNAWSADVNQLPLEDEPWYSAPYERLYRVAAELYQCNIEEMSNYWDAVDAEVRSLNLAQLRAGNLTRAHIIHTLPEILRLRNGPPSAHVDVKPDNPLKWKVRTDA